MKIFLPPLDSQWRLKDDWAIPDAFRSHTDHMEPLLGISGYGWKEWEKATGSSTNETDWVPRYHDWLDEYAKARGMNTLPSGTVFQTERYHVSRSGHEQITIKLLASPNPLLTPRKLGGKLKGAGRLYFKLEQFNTLPELEEAHVS